MSCLRCYDAPVRARVLPSLLALCLASSLFACGVEPPAVESEDAAAKPTPAPAPEPAPEPTPEVEPAPAPEPAPDPDPDPVMAERKQALADVGRSAFDALKAGKLDELLALTPRVDPYLQEVCPRLPQADRQELAARFDYCHQQIAWDAVAEAQVFAAKPTGAAAEGCEQGIEDYGRLQLFLHMQDASIWRVEFYGAVGQEGKAIGLSGEVRCAPTQDAPALR